MELIHLCFKNCNIHAQFPQIPQNLVDGDKSFL